MPISALIYDIEIHNAIPPKQKSERVPGVTYCGGWGDHAGMGISCICAYDYIEDRYRVFTRGNFQAFKDLCEARELIVGFNSIPFDNMVVREFLAYDILDEKSYDILREIWKSEGLTPLFSYPTHTGYGLDACCAENFGMKKTGDGALAPLNWQKGMHGDVIDYCLNDVRLTKALFEYAMAGEPIKNPKKPGTVLTLRKPFTTTE